MVELSRTGHDFALATLLETRGSTPVFAGAKALIESDGTIHGTVGGGAVEAEAIRLAQQALRRRRPLLLNHSLHAPDPGDPNPVCGGSVRILLDPLMRRCQRHFMNTVRTLEQRQRGIWLTLLRQGSRLEVKPLFLSNAETVGYKGLPGPRAVARALRGDKPLLVQLPYQKSEVFLDPISPEPLLVIVGGGHVGQAIAAQANLLELELVVIEDRPEFASPALFPTGTRLLCGPVPEQLARVPMQHDTFIVLVTRGHQQDSEALRACIGQPAGYIGMIGSLRKVALLRQQFLEQGWATAKEFDRVFAPVGLDIGAVTVPEIATSVLAQIVSVRRRGRITKMLGRRPKS
jgi:xanthine dehydrogenase accessory factor